VTREGGGVRKVRENGTITALIIRARANCEKPMSRRGERRYKGGRKEEPPTLPGIKSARKEGANPARSGPWKRREE